MNLTAFILISLVLQIICLWIGGRSSQALKTNDDYFLAGKGIRFFPLMMTFLATQVGGGLILGASEEAYRYGWSVLFYPLGASLGLIVLGLGIGRRLAQFQISTVAQIFEEIYGSSFLKKIASILSILTLFMILIAQIVGSSKFMVSLGLENKIWFIAFWAIVIVYTAVGGLQAVVATDIIQALFFVFIFFLTFGLIFYSSDFTLGQVLDLGFNSQNFSFDFSKLVGWLLMPLLFMTIEQDMGQRCFAGNSPKTVSQATFWAGLLTLIVSIVPVFLGVIARGLNIEVPPGASVLMITVMHTTTPFFTAIVGSAVLAAIISTADSLINAIGSNLSQDFNYLKDKNLRSSQLLSILISIFAIFCSYYFDNIVDLLIQSYNLSVSCLFVPIFFALFKKSGHFLSAALSVIFGAIGFILFQLIWTPIPKEILSVLFSLAGFTLGQLIKINAFSLDWRKLAVPRSVE